MAISTLEVSLETQSVCRSTTQVYIVEVMGRNAGWLAAASGCIVPPSTKQPSDPPHIILFPERPFEESKFLAKVKECVQR